MVDISIANPSCLKVVVSFSGNPIIISTSSGRINRKTIISESEIINVSIIAYDDIECICNSLSDDSISARHVIYPIKPSTDLKESNVWKIRYTADEDISATIVSRGNVDSLCFGCMSDVLLSSDICLYVKEQKNFIVPLDIVKSRMGHLDKGILLGFFELHKSETGLSKNTVRKNLVSNTIKLSDFPNISGSTHENMLLRSISDTV